MEGKETIVAERPGFVVRHPFVTVVVILVVELALIGALHLLLGWSPLAVAVAALVALVLVSILMG